MNDFFSHFVQPPERIIPPSEIEKYAILPPNHHVFPIAITSSPPTNKSFFPAVVLKPIPTSHEWIIPVAHMYVVDTQLPVFGSGKLGTTNKQTIGYVYGLDESMMAMTPLPHKVLNRIQGLTFIGFIFWFNDIKNYPHP